jgi:hypothetical protein
MFAVYFESHMGFMSLFQIPWRFAGCVPGRDVWPREQVKPNETAQAWR